MLMKKKGNIRMQKEAKDCWEQIAIKMCKAQLALNPRSRY